MIVDLLRNDLAVVSEPGSVRVPHLFQTERYPTLTQMTSTVESTIRPGVGYADLFRALFPCGSITGAPKLRAMRRIGELEHGPRGVYCGTIGYIAPGSKVRGRSTTESGFQRRHSHPGSATRRGAHGDGQRHRLGLRPRLRVRRVPTQGEFLAHPRRSRRAVRVNRNDARRSGRDHPPRAPPRPPRAQCRGARLRFRRADGARRDCPCAARGRVRGTIKGAAACCTEKAGSRSSRRLWTIGRCERPSSIRTLWIRAAPFSATRRRGARPTPRPSTGRASMEPTRPSWSTNAASLPRGALRTSL